MYGKLFESMYDGTLVSNWEALVTFQQMIILADQDGLVDITPHALSARTGIPLTHIEAGIKILENEDIYSRSDVQGGIRIELLDTHRPWGWKIVNYMYYRNLASHEDKKRKDRERIAGQRADAKANKNKGVASCSELSQGVANVAHTNTNTDTKNTCASDEKFKVFWKGYPKKVDKIDANKLFLKLSVKNQEIAIKDSPSRYLSREKKYVPSPARYLRKELWNDERENEGENNNEYIL